MDGLHTSYPGGLQDRKDITMNRNVGFLYKVILLVLIWLLWWWALSTPLSNVLNLLVIVGGVLLTFPFVRLGRKILDREPTVNRATWITTLVHTALGLTFGVPIIRAIITYPDWIVWIIPLPAGIGLALVIFTGAAFLVVVANLALKGLGAPFFIALSQKLAVDWLYARTRNPMVLAGLALLVSLGIWFQSMMFVLWALLVFTPALLYFVKDYEERELEIRFGASYLEYKARTPMLFPGKRQKRT